MLHNFFLIAFLLTGFPVVAQKTVFSYQTDFAISAKKSACESIVVSDERTGKTTIILKGNDKVEYLLLNQEFEVEAKMHPSNGLENTIFKSGFPWYLAGVSNNKGSCFFYSIDRLHFSMEMVDFKNNTISNKPVFEIPNDEHSIKWFTVQGRFYLLTANNKKGELVLHIVDENGVVSNKNIPVDLNGFNPDKLTVSEYFSYSHVFYPWQETELIEATDLTKIYPYPDKIVIIVGNDKEPPHVWTIDLQTYNILKRKFDLSGFSGFNGKKEKFYNNTYLYGENLYVLNTSKQKIEIGIFNFNSGRLIKKYEITEASNIQFAETPVGITTKGRLKRENVIKNNKELIRELFKGSNGIALACNSKGQILLTCGVYDKEMRESGGYYQAGIQQASMPTGRTYAGSNVPVMRTYSKVNFMSNYKEGKSFTYTRTVNFKIILDSSEFKLAQAGEKKSTLDKINSFLKSLPEETQATNTFMLNRNYYLGYYSPKDKTFVIKEIEK